MSVISKTELLLELKKYVRKGYQLSNILTINDPLEKIQLNCLNTIIKIDFYTKF